MHKIFFSLFAVTLCAAGCLAQNVASTAPRDTMTAKDAATVAPNENLIVEGVPAIPRELAETMNRYTEFRAASFSSWHPTKREMLIRTRFGNTTQVHRVSMPGGDRSQVTFFPDNVGGAIYQPTSGDYFVFSKDTGGNEFNQIYRFDWKDGNITMLTDGKSRHGFGNWSDDGKQMVYGRLKTTLIDVNSELHIVNPAQPESDRVLTTLPGGGWGSLVWSPDARTMLVVESISANESYIHSIDAATGASKILTAKGGAEKVSYDGIAFAKDGKGFYTTTDRDSEFKRLAYFDLATMRPTFLTESIEWDVDDFELSDDGKMLAFVTNENGIGVLHVIDTATGKERALPKLPVGIVSGVEWHKNNRDLAFTFTSTRASSDIYSIDVANNKLERWTASETGGLNTDSLVEPSLVKWKSFDDREITGFLYRPPSKFTGKRPVVINIHGGPEGQARPGFLGRTNYFINELGVAYIYPNVRGSSGFGKTYLKLDNGMKREDTYKDIGALFDWIKTQPDLDASRVMVTGGSYGGHMTFAIATLYPERIACALPVVGISNFVTFLKNTETYRRDLRRVEYGDERDPEMNAFLTRIAPMTNAARIAKPMFVVQGKNDPRVPISESAQMVETVRKGNVPVWYLVAKDEGHGFQKKANVDYQFYATALFMQQYLLK